MLPVPVPIGATVVSLPKGAVEVATSVELGATDVEAPTVTVTVFAEVTVTVAGPHSPLPPVAARGEVLASDPPRPSELPPLLPLVVATAMVETAPVPVPVGPFVVELPMGYGADPVGWIGYPEGRSEATYPAGPYLG